MSICYKSYKSVLIILSYVKYTQLLDWKFSEALSIEQALISVQALNSAQIAGDQILHYWGRRLY